MAGHKSKKSPVVGGTPGEVSEKKTIPGRVTASKPVGKAVKKISAKPAQKKQASNARRVVEVNVKPNTENIVETYMTQGKNQFDKFSEDATNAGKEQLEAFVRSGNIALKGFEGIFKSYASLTQNSTEKNAQLFKTFVGCKTFDELTDAQKLAQKGYDEWVSGAAEISEQYVKVATEAFEPLSSHINGAVKKAGSAAA